MKRIIFHIAPRILQSLVWIPARVGLRLFSRLRVYGKDNLGPPPKPIIFASNHISEVDPILIPALLHPFSRLFPIFYVSKTKYEGYPTIKSRLYGGIFFKLWGAHPAYRGYRDYERSLREHIDLLEHGKSVQIFPQGGDALIDGDIEKPSIHGGFVFLAWRTSTPIVPTAIKGTYRTSFKDFFLRRKRYAVAFGEPVYPEELFGHDAEPTIEEIKETAERIFGRVKRLYEEIDEGARE